MTAAARTMRSVVPARETVTGTATVGTAWIADGITATETVMTRVTTAVKEE